MTIDYTVQIWMEGGQYVAHAMLLDVVSSGRSPEEARRALDEAVHLFLVTAGEVGTLSEVLEEAGYRPTAKRWVGPALVAIERHAAFVAS